MKIKTSVKVGGFFGNLKQKVSKGWGKIKAWGKPKQTAQEQTVPVATPDSPAVMQ